MASIIYQVKILNDAMSLTDWLAIISLIISLISVAIVLIDKYLAHRLKAMNLSCSVKSVVWNNVEEKIFVFMIFSNKSSEPLLIPSIEISLYKETIPDDQFGNNGGSSLLAPSEVKGFQYGFPYPTKKVDFQSSSLTFPISLLLILRKEGL